MTQITHLNTRASVDADAPILPVQQPTQNGATPLHQAKPSSGLATPIQGQAQARQTRSKRHAASPIFKNDEQAEESSMQPLHPNSVAEFGESSDSAVQLGSSADYGVFPSTSSDDAQLDTIDAKLTPDHLGASVAEASGSLFQSSLTSVALSGASAVAVGGAGGSGGSSSSVTTSTTSTAPTTETTTNTTAANPTTTTPQSTTSGLNATGNNKANRLNGSASDNILDGMGGDDILEGKGGNDTLIGGTGKDTAVYKGHAADYEISYDQQADVWCVRDLNAADGDEGADVLSGVERLQFSSGTLALFGPVRNEQGQILLAARLVGGSGADVVPMGSGYIAVGGGGNDTYIARNAQHQLLEQDTADDDTVITYVNLAMPDNVENMTLAEPDEIASGLVSSSTPSSLPIVAVAELPNLNNTSFTQGFVVNEGATPSVTVNSVALSAAQVAAKFTSSTTSGQTLYIAKAGAFDGSETVVVNASQTDAAGNTGQASAITLKPIDTTAPVVSLVELADADNAAFDSGFTITQEASVAVSVNGVVLSVDQVAAKFSTSTANGQTTYIAKTGAFEGSETVVVTATGQTDSAGNTGTAALTLKPIDTKAPDAPSLVEVFDADTLTTSRYEEFQVNTYTEGNQANSSITALSDGGFVVTWNGAGNGDNNGIYAQRYNAGGQKQGAEFQVNTYTGGAQWFPDIDALSDGGFVVTWQGDGSGDDDGIFAQRYNAAGQKQGTEFLVNTYTADGQRASDITALSDGDFVVTWSSFDQDGSGSGIYAQRYNTVGQKLGDEFQVNTYTNGYQVSSSITALSDGGFVMTWESAGNGDIAGIYGQRYNADGQKQGIEFQVNTYTEGYQHQPSITALNDGGFVVAWTSKDQGGSSYGISAQRYNATGQRQSAEYQVNTHMESDQNTPSITALNDGGFVVAWTSEGQDGSSYGIYAQRYNAAGQKQGTEFQVNTYTASSQGNSSITALNDGGFVVTWTSDRQDGSGTGIYAQRYDAQGNMVLQTVTHDSGFSVTQGASVLVTLNGVSLSADQVVAKFSTSTANGQTTYTAKTGAFDGSETVAVNASQTDAAGNTGQTTAITLKPIDTTAPTGGTGMSFKSVSSSAQDPTPNDAITNQANGSVVFSYTGTDLAVGEKFQYSIDANSWTDVSAIDSVNNTVTINNLSLTSGPTVQIRALDAVGNATSILSSQTITYDTTAPASINSLALSADTGSKDFVTQTASQTISATLSQSLTSTDRLYGTLNGGSTWTDITSFVSGTTVSWTGVTLAGSNALQLKTVDAAGNTTLSTAQSYELLSNVAITGAVDDNGSNTLLGTIQAMTGSADDTTPSFSGALDAPLPSGYKVQIFNNGSYVSDANVTNTASNATWNYTFNASKTVYGTNKVEAKVVDATGNVYLTGAAYNFNMTNNTVTIGGASESGMAAGNTDTLATKYRYVYVRVDAPTSDRVSFSELQVFSNGTNIAQGKSITTSFSMAGYAPDLLNGQFGDYAFTSNYNSKYGWIKVDLGGSFAIDSVLLWGGQNNARSGGATLWVSNSNADPSSTATLTSGGAIQIAGPSGYMNTTQYMTGYVPTDDSTPTIFGTLASGLGAGYKLGIYDGSTYLGDASVRSDNTWTYTASTAMSSGSTHNLSAKIYQGLTTNTLVSNTANNVYFKISPVVLDLNHDGQISYANTLMDVTGTGTISKVTWAAPEDGVLVWNKYGDGLLHDKSQYAFGDPAKGITDLQGLAQNFDSNHDGVLNAADDKFGQFMVWQDKNGDGISQADEVKSLTDMGIASLNLNSDGVKSTPIAGVDEAGRTTAMQSDGQNMLVADATFSYTKAIVLQGMDASQDTFVIDQGLTQIKGFSMLEGDVIDLSGLLSELHSKNGKVSDYVQTVQRGNDTVIQVDATGHHDFANASNHVVLSNITATWEQLQQQNHMVI